MCLSYYLAAPCKNALTHKKGTTVLRQCPSAYCKQLHRKLDRAEGRVDSQQDNTLCAVHLALDEGGHGHDEHDGQHDRQIEHQARVNAEERRALRERLYTKMDLSFYKGKKVLVTGHTGFKGSWLCRILVKAGAQVTGYSLVPPTTPNLFYMADVENNIKSVIGDIRDLEHLKKVFEETQPEIVLHLAAQPIVRDSYKDPVYTYETNVMGTVNICECVRLNPCVKSFLNVTTDKVYHNN